MNKANIGLMGCLTNNRNMGCLALTYSLLRLLESIAQEEELEITYCIFENNTVSDKVSQMCSELKISDKKIRTVPAGVYRKLRSQVKHFKENKMMKTALEQCDLVIDLTQGDSFTDIYGQDRFNNHTRIKSIVEKKGIPFILGPQTYGPFMSEKNRNFAKKVIEGASLVVSRDQKSADYIRGFSDKKVEVVTDLAFFLPCEKAENQMDRGKVKVGVNISGLLIKNKNEGTQLATGMRADYDGYIRKLLDYLTANPRYEIHLIPHVGDDGNLEFGKQYENAVVHDAFASPVKAKSCISGMDIFIGARMHATIAAFSSGVATIPVAYSRKFAGLYDAIGYKHTVDLCSLSTDEAFSMTIAMIANYEDLRKEVQELGVKVDAEKGRLRTILKNEINYIMG